MSGIFGCLTRSPVYSHHHHPSCHHHLHFPLQNFNPAYLLHLLIYILRLHAPHLFSTTSHSGYPPSHPVPLPKRASSPHHLLTVTRRGWPSLLPLSLALHCLLTVTRQGWRECGVSILIIFDMCPYKGLEYTKHSSASSL